MAYVSAAEFKEWVRLQVDDTVELPIPDVDTFARVEALKGTWALFWENSDSGLFGLPMYIKE